MTDQEKREKAIRVLEGNYKSFVLRHNGELVTVNELIALLKSQEPRLLTLEEAKTVEGYVWTECYDTPVLHVSLFRNGYFIEPLEEPFPVDSMNWPGYNKQWRYWTSCPTDEQREKEPWNG